jgi:AbrB family looped-hinge helix DNA binding protein
MPSTIDKLGRIVIPKAIRDEAGWQPGTSLEFRYRYGVLEICSVTSDVEDSKFEKRGTVWVALPAVAATPLDGKLVDAVLEGVQESAARDLTDGAA